MTNFQLYCKAFCDRYIYFVPIIMLLATLVTNFVDYKEGVYNYVIVGNSIGYSFASNVIAFYLFNFTNKRYCWFTRNAPIGLFLVNCVDIIGSRLNYVTYSCIYNISICLIITTLALFFKIKTIFAND